ncbi:MAG TPA: hypothetical protein VFH39_03105 [Candidatus Saccharimonadales bacterium]|nr:hypothetical protein [Candidatus Saccharimonadales bacterium]
MIAIAIVSLVLVTAYASANRNVGALQDSQEHSEALKLVQAQTEFLRARGAPGGGNTCFASDGTVTGNCTFNSDGSYSASGRYKLKIQQGGGDCAADAYTVSATWDSLLGANAQVTVCYRPSEGS